MSFLSFVSLLSSKVEDISEGSLLTTIDEQKSELKSYLTDSHPEFKVDIESDKLFDRKLPQNKFD